MLVDKPDRVEDALGRVRAVPASDRPRAASASSFDLADAVAVVTGATRGIGRAVAEALGRAGTRVVVVGRTGDQAPHPTLPGTVESVVAELAAEGVEARGVQADLSDPDATKRIVDETLLAFDRCDVLVNNAAFTSNGPVLEIPWRRWQTAFRLQVVAPMQLCQAFVPAMLQRGSGRVLNVSSGTSQALTPNLALYSTSKLAMERWNEYLHLELGGGGVSFNTLRVDRLVATEGWRHVLETQGEEIATGGAGLAALVTPSQAAEHVLWMLGQPAEWSGQTVGFEDVSRLGGPPTPAEDDLSLS
ncbi:MAG TPA: SDR family oxidoreductase [Acidimicrobiales bacterium]|nr:SDR family oxidoreductase [Acidimicrobiales bacterium]